MTLLRVLALALMSAMAAVPAHARVEIPDRAVMTMAFANATEYLNGYLWAGNNVSTADAEGAILDQIEDAYAMGVRVFLFDAAAANGANQVARLGWWNAAARAFNSANQTDPVCIAPMYEKSDGGDGTTDGALPMFDAADAGGASSPLCEIDGDPVIATWGSNICVNPLPALAARGPDFAVITTTYNNGINYTDSSCISALRSDGATTVKSYLWASGNGAFSNASNVSSKQAEIEATGSGVEFVLGIGNARDESCGEGGTGPKSSDYRLTDLNFWQHFLDGWKIAIDSDLNYVMMTLAGPGDLGEGSYITTSRVCDPRDRVNHTENVAGIAGGFTCPNVPDYLTAAIPSGFVRSFSLPRWTRPGFWRVAQTFSEWLRTGVEPDADSPFVAFAYRQHKWGLDKAWQICPDGNYEIRPASINGQYNGDYIALTSWSETPIRVRVRLAGDTIYDGTLPAKQASLGGVAGQVKVAIGERLGRPVIEVLNDSGDVVSSKEGLLRITDNPQHWGGKTGRNPGLYADFVNVSLSGGWSGISIKTTGDATSNVVRDISGSGIVTGGDANNVNIVGNTIYDASNTGIVVGADPGGGNGQSMAVANNIISGSDLGIGAFGEVGSDLIVANNLLNGNIANMATAVSSAASGTITSNPLFVSSSDLRLQSGSPARGAGASSFLTGTDRDGRSRGSPPDIGAYEYYDPSSRSPCTTAPVGRCDPGGIDYPCPHDRIVCPIPPTLTSPTVINVPEGGGSWTLGDNEDAQIVCPVRIKGRLDITGGRNVNMIGCEFVTDWETNNANRAVNIVGVQNMYIEGVLADANDGCDGFSTFLHASNQPGRYSQTKTTFLNTWTGNQNYDVVNGNCHGDCIHVQGQGQTGTVDLDLTNFTCRTKAQGFFVPDRQIGADNHNTYRFKNVNAGYGKPGVPKFDVYKGGLVLYWLTGHVGDKDDLLVDVTLENVWSEWTKTDRQVMPGPAAGAPAQYYDFSKPNEITFPNTRIVGKINKGVPPGGDFVPREWAGLNYDRSRFCLN